jgi:hypothetical protein
MLTPAGPAAPGYLDRQARRRVRPPRVRPSRSDPADEVGVVLGCQWPGPRPAPRAGWPALARAMLAEAVLDAGIARRRGPVAERDRWSAARWLLEANGDSEPLPLEMACALAGLDADRVRAVARLRLP